MPDLKFDRGTLGEQTENYTKESFHYKGLIRDAVYKTVLLSGTILGFSVSLFSTTFFKVSIDSYLLKHSWYFLFGAMVSGTFYLLIESRIIYTRLYQKWMLTSNASFEFPKDTLRSFFLAIWICIVGLLFPTNKAFGTWADTEQRKIRIEAQRRVILLFLLLEDIMPIFEIIVFVLFSWGLIDLIRAFN